ncbi:ATP-binding cassette domain-containing protein [Streptomyces sp. NPDC101116]|uniref:ABC transporter ATP-binding protein n=1 Tax=Streptomyces sp. NPDC101116 TaxID=3366107 RepID=UPI003823C6A8
MHHTNHLPRAGGGAAIEVHGLTKTFRGAKRQPGLLGALRSIVAPERTTKTAVEDVSFAVNHGELVALLGPNGAGKSTTIKMLTGILVPSSGEARVAGIEPYRERERNARNIGAVFGQRSQLWWDLPVRDSFAILRDIYGVSQADHRRRLAEFDELLELSSFWDTQVRHLSLGQRVRSDLAAALLHDPPVVFLDEPTIGMDVVVKEQVRRFLQQQVEQRGVTVLLTTHDMTEVARLARRVILINHGRIVVDGSLESIRKQIGITWQVHATLVDPADDLRLEGVKVLHRDGPRVVLAPADEAELTPHRALKLLIERYAVADVAIVEADLEDVMRDMYLRTAAGAPQSPSSVALSEAGEA